MIHPEVPIRDPGAKFVSANDMVNSRCPHCGRTLAARPDQVGLRLRCPSCRQSFTIEALAPPVPQVPPPSTGSGEKPVPFHEIVRPVLSPSSAPEPLPERQPAPPEDVLWIPTEATNELVHRPPAPQHGRKTKITETFPRTRPAVFQAVLQALRDFRCHIVAMDQTNSFAKFSFTLPSGMTSEHSVFVFESADGSARMDLSSLTADPDGEFDPYYQAIIREVGKHLRFAPEPEPPQSTWMKPDDDEWSSPHHPSGWVDDEQDDEDEFEEEDRRPVSSSRRRRRRSRWNRSGQRTGLVDAVAIMYLVLGCLNFACAISLLAGGAILVNLFGEYAGAGALIGGIVVVLAVIIALMGLPAFFAAYGIWNRRYWGYILGLVLAVIHGLWALANLLRGDVCTVTVSGGCCVFALIVLCNSQYSAEFE